MQDFVFDEEVVLCEKNFTSVSKSKKGLIILGIVWIIVSFLANNIVGLIVSGNPFAMFRYGGPYWIGFGNAILGLIILIIGIIQYLNSSDKTSLDSRISLTNKRIISTKFYSENNTFEQSILLEHVTGCTLSKLTGESGQSYVVGIETPKDHFSFAFQDQEFYDILSKVIRAYI